MKPTKRTLGIEYAIRDILLPARELEKKGVEVLKLHIGDPNKFDFRTPKHVRDALCAAVEKCDNGYEESEGNLELRRAIVDKERKKNKIDIDENDVIVTNGVTESHPDDHRRHHRVRGRGPGSRSELSIIYRVHQVLRRGAGILPHHRRGELAAGHRRPEEEDHAAARSTSWSSTRTTRPAHSTRTRC